MIDQSSSAQVYTDFQGLEKLKYQAKSEDNNDTKRAVAEQFEALFMQMMLKSMRDAGGNNGLLDGPQSDLYKDMYDQQLALFLSSSKSVGLSDIIYRQLGGEIEADGVKKPLWSNPDEFIQEIYSDVADAADSINAKPEALLSIAALETGWGQHVMHNDNEGFNLFGIKADSQWQGGSIKAKTLEFEQGFMQQKHENFRSYTSASDSIADFVNFLKSNPRYEKALENSNDPEQFISELHKAGYATDPDYVDKVLGVMNGKQLTLSLKNLKE